MTIKKANIKKKKKIKKTNTKKNKNDKHELEEELDED